EVVRVLQRNCLGCHRPGGVAPMSLATYEEARPWAKAIKEELLEKRMPPGGVVKGFGDFRNSFPITQREIDLIVNWVEGGAPAGKPDLLPPGKLYSDDWTLGKPDIVLKPRTSQSVSSDTDDYREIVLPVKRKGTISIRAIDLRPEKRSVVHCATFYVINDDRKPGGSASPAAEGRRRILGTWAPGQAPFQLPDGTNFALSAGSDVIARIHYRGSGEATKDRSEIGLYLSDTAGRQVSELRPNGNLEVVMTGSRAESRSTTVLSEDLEALAILPPQSDPKVLSLQVTAYRPDGTPEILLWATATQFDWQPTLVWKNPVSLPKGTALEVLAYSNNVGPQITTPQQGFRPLVLFVTSVGGGGKVEPAQAHRQ
ncbi:MAG TPA: cytochrome c, partial [Blastocatellia bacterium]|nr:cytochrome c [Blastocatellia bacterium]